MVNKKKAVVGGQICLDIVPAMSKAAGTDLRAMMVPGNVVMMEGIELFIGGGAGNTSQAMAVMGGNVELIARIGDDRAGRVLKDVVSDLPLQNGLIEVKDHRTSYTIAITPAGMDRRTLLHCQGAGSLFYDRDLDWDSRPDAALFHFGYPTIIKSMFPNDGEEFCQMMKRTKSYGIATSVDMCPVHTDDGSDQLNWDKILRKALPYTDFFLPSIEEMMMLFAKERRLELRAQAMEENCDFTELISLERDVKPITEMALEYGAAVVLIKCGVPGVFIKTGSVERMRRVGERLGLPAEEWADLEWFEPSYQPSRIASGMACGDSTIGAFLLSVLEGYSPKQCMEHALATGALCVSTYDAISGLLPIEECRAKIDAGWAKTSVKLKP